MGVLFLPPGGLVRAVRSPPALHAQDSHSEGSARAKVKVMSIPTVKHIELSRKNAFVVSLLNKFQISLR